MVTLETLEDTTITKIEKFTKMVKNLKMENVICETCKQDHVTKVIKTGVSYHPSLAWAFSW